jgi:hypothetical protein
MVIQISKTPGQERKSPCSIKKASRQKGKGKETYRKLKKDPGLLNDLIYMVRENSSQPEYGRGVEDDR